MGVGEKKGEGGEGEGLVEMTVTGNGKRKGQTHLTAFTMKGPFINDRDLN